MHLKQELKLKYDYILNGSVNCNSKKEQFSPFVHYIVLMTRTEQILGERD